MALYNLDSDLYDILQVAPHAEPEVIESAYKRLARKYHPDVNQSADAHARMRALNQAYEILSNPTERARYDSKREHESVAPRRPPRRSAPKPKRPTTKARASKYARWTPPTRNKKETVQEAVAVNETLIRKAVDLSHVHRTITSELLQKLLHIKYPRAVYLFATLMEQGLIDEHGHWTVNAESNKTA